MKNIIDTLKLMNWWIILFCCLAGFTYRGTNFAIVSQFFTGTVAILFQWFSARRKLVRASA